MKNNFDTGQHLIELRAIYDAVDQEFSDWQCETSTECCRFGITGRQPYVTSIERLAIATTIRKLGGPRSWKRALPLHSVTPNKQLPLMDAEKRCPLLNSQNKCAIYDWRPLGCRTFFCDRATGSRVRHAQIQQFVHAIQQIAVQHEPNGDKGQTLLTVLKHIGIDM